MERAEAGPGGAKKNVNSLKEELVPFGAQVSIIALVLTVFILERPYVKKNTKRGLTEAFQELSKIFRALE